jgi:hypothetical protein
VNVGSGLMGAELTLKFRRAVRRVSAFPALQGGSAGV